LPILTQNSNVGQTGAGVEAIPQQVNFADLDRASDKATNHRSQLMPVFITVQHGNADKRCQHRCDNH